jgi:hypothetical protein
MRKIVIPASRCEVAATITCPPVTVADKVSTLCRPVAAVSKIVSSQTSQPSGVTASNVTA